MSVEAKRLGKRWRPSRGDLVLSALGMALACFVMVQRSAERSCLPLNSAEMPAEPSKMEGADFTKALQGVWNRFEGRSEGQDMRIWLFHPEGHGFYRYGQVGHTRTQIFDYQVEGVAKYVEEADRAMGATLKLKFRKNGEEHHLRTRIGIRNGQRFLQFDNDPRESGAVYWSKEGGKSHGVRGVDDEVKSWRVVREEVPESEEEGKGIGLGNRMWIDRREYASGGYDFRFYQLSVTAMDGRGVGWYHEGDLDEWTTESLSYRIDGSHLEIFFDLREEFMRTPYSITPGAKGRVLRLAQDPRDFAMAHEYLDMGRSFAMESLP